MARGSSRSSSSPKSSTSNTRRTATAPSPSKSNQTSLARPGMGTGLMSSFMTGMAFGAGVELMRSLFRGNFSSGNIMPLLLAGGAGFGAHKFLTKSKYKPLYVGLITVGTFLVSSNMMRSNYEDDEPRH